jgi:cytochrome c-type biogenesis protein CcmE
MKTRHKRLVFILLGLAGLGVAAGLALNAFQSNLVFFYSPSQVFSGEAPVNKPFRVGGLVEPGSVKKDGLKVNFVVTDNVKSIPVHYEGILPDLFREGQGVVAQGRLGADKQFVAEQVLAKHDENYMPPEVEGVLKDAKVKP